LLILSFRGALEARQGIVYAGRDCFCAKSFEEPAPPAWREDEVSAILDAAVGRIDGRADDAGFLLQSQWEKNVQVDLMPVGIDRFDLEDEAQGEAKGFAREVDSLARGSWTGWLNPFWLDIGPPGIALPLHQVPPDYRQRGGDNGGGTNGQTHANDYSP
jgi:hypothetical protein